MCRVCHKHTKRLSWDPLIQTTSHSTPHSISRKVWRQLDKLNLNGRRDIDTYIHRCDVLRGRELVHRRFWGVGAKNEDRRHCFKLKFRLFGLLLPGQRNEQDRQVNKTRQLFDWILLYCSLTVHVTKTPSTLGPLPALLENMIWIWFGWAATLVVF